MGRRRGQRRRYMVGPGEGWVAENRSGIPAVPQYTARGSRHIRRSARRHDLASGFSAQSHPQKRRRHRFCTELDACFRIARTSPSCSPEFGTDGLGSPAAYSNFVDLSLAIRHWDRGCLCAILFIFVKSGERSSDGMDLESRQDQPVTVSKAALEHIDD